MNETLTTLQEIFAPLAARPWLLLAILAAPLIFLARSKRIYPHIPLAIAFAIPCFLTFGVLFRADLFTIVLIADLVVVLVSACDVFTLPSRKSITVEREAMRIASLNQSHPVSLTLINQSQRSIHAWVRDDCPEQFETDPKQFVLRLGPRSRTTVHYEFKSHQRGEFELQTVYLRARSWLGFWIKDVHLPVQTTVHVYPDMKQLSEYAILARTNRLSLMGVRRTRKIGQDNEFERLRDYTRDDNYKHIDWRSTARRNKLTVKDYQSNQSQRLIFMLDCGRMMTNEVGGISLLDHSLNAMLMLSFVALRQGDSVGLVCFSDQVHTYVPPKSGMSQMNQLLHASFNRFPNLVESRYDEAFLHLATTCKKRALIVLVTNVIDEVNSHQVDQYLGNLVGRHLPIGVLLRDHQLFDAAESPHPQGANLYRAAAAAEILSWRHQVLTDLSHRGVLALDLFPEDMTAPLINQYLEIKARHLL